MIAAGFDPPSTARRPSADLQVVSALQWFALTQRDFPIKAINW
jgi:hypothetical protein